jgi:hypothetical protein
MKKIYWDSKLNKLSKITYKIPIGTRGIMCPQYEDQIA